MTGSSSNCCKYKANCTRKENQKKQNLSQKKIQKLFWTFLVLPRQALHEKFDTISGSLCAFESWIKRTSFQAMYLLLQKKRSRIWKCGIEQDFKRLFVWSVCQVALERDNAPHPLMRRQSLMTFHWWNVLEEACAQTIHGFYRLLIDCPMAHFPFM